MLIIVLIDWLGLSLQHSPSRTWWSTSDQWPWWTGSRAASRPETAWRTCSWRTPRSCSPCHREQNQTSVHVRVNVLHVSSSVFCFVFLWLICTQSSCSLISRTHLLSFHFISSSLFLMHVFGFLLVRCLWRRLLSSWMNYYHCEATLVYLPLPFPVHLQLIFVHVLHMCSTSSVPACFQQLLCKELYSVFLP